MHNTFGGHWTDEKLARIEKYLTAYLKIFHSNEKARFFRTVYFDGFAGSGKRQDGRAESIENLDLFSTEEATEVNALQRGSVEVALELSPGFSDYIFIERDREKALELTKIIRPYREEGAQVVVEDEDANTIIPKWCNGTNWKRTRAVMFLDPFGLQVDWETLKAISNTKAIDLWLLFPLGQGVNRMLTKKQLPPQSWSDRLTRTFGTEEWRSEFYQPTNQDDLFGSEGVSKTADFETIKAFFIKRLKTIFPYVSPKPLTLYNSKRNPLFILCFAAANSTKGGTAVKIANDLLRP